MNDKKRKTPIPQRREDIKPEISSVKAPAVRMARIYDGREREKAGWVSVARSELACLAIR
jgi:hypothetical protein